MPRKIQISFLAVMSVVLTSLLGGCGSGNKEGTTIGFTRVSEATCAQCHGSAVESKTGKSIYGEFTNSTHFAINLGCQDCHGGGSAHWGIGPIQFPNPDAAGVCSSCHSNSPSADLRPSSAHFPNLTASIQASSVIWDNMTTAAYITSKNTNNCLTCHKPHDNRVLQQNFDWAASAHAAIKEAPWIHYDFKARDTCNRCHTTTGYVKYLTTGDTKAWAAANSSDKTKEVLRCDGCHTDYSWKRRIALTAVGGVQLPYGTYSSVIPPPGAVIPYGKPQNSNTSTVVIDVGDANLCINCHSGTNSGKGIDTAPASVLTGTFAPLNSHYFGAAGDLYALNGYEYQSHESYLNPGFEHYQLGTLASTGFGTTRGPCVVCHMLGSANHLLTPVIQTPVGTGPRGIINGTITSFPALTPVCGTCHGPLPNPDNAPDISSLVVGGGGITDLKIEYQRRLAELEAALNAKGIFYNPDSYPYFFTSTGAQFKAWPNKGVLGAAFNLNNLTREPGGYVHNHSYTALLIYDSLDFLANGVITGTLITPTFPTGRVP